MDAAEFRRWGEAIIDWIADYLEHAERYPVAPKVAPGEIRAQLPANPPEQPEEFAKVWADVQRIIVPGLLHWQSPKFFGYFPSNNSYPSILGELLSAGLGVQGMLWATSPACTELETHVLDWLIELLGLPNRFRSSSTGGGVIQDSASSAALCAMIAACHRASGGLVIADGMDGRWTAYVSREAHSSLVKAARLCGLGESNLRLIDTDEQFAMRPDKLEQAIVADRAAGKRPVFVAATIGTTSSMAVDPIDAIGPIARREGLWLHVDAAMAGTAAICPEFRYLHEHLDWADSYCVNPHKWMFTNFDCDCFYTADRAALTGAMNLTPEYLRNRASAAGEVIDYRDWQVPLGRRFRALKLWFVLRCFGAEGIRSRIRVHTACAEEFARWVQADPRFEFAAPPRLNLVCFRHRNGDEATQTLLDAITAEGCIFLSPTRLNGRLTLRMSIGQTRTTIDHVREAWQAIQRAAPPLE